MKKRLSLLCIALMTLITIGVTNAQQFGQLGNGIGGGQAAFRQVSGDLLQGPGRPGRLWFEANFADRGLGFENSYFTLGGKTRLFQDFLDGRWLAEGQLHHGIEDDGGFFANVGIERVFSIKPANADISVGAFYDYDGDDQQAFSEGFHQFGISGAIKTPRWDLIGNGYLPVSTDTFTRGDHTGANCFLENRIVLQAGIEAALEGFDVTLRTRPQQLAFANGYIDFGGYHYNSDAIESFAGGRLRAGFQLMNGMMLAAEVNHDERFDTTGVLSIGYTFGAHSSGFGNEYAGLARDLEKFSRNDHIVRFSQDLVVAVDPATGLAYNVIHANNTQLGAGDGTFESPFADLASVEASSSAGDLIIVHEGDGTDTGYNTGIVLQDRQQLLSGGIPQFINLQDGTRLDVASKIDGGKATLSNAGGNEVIRLANNNVVGNINVDATGANFGIFGDGIEGGSFNGNMIAGATLDGIGLRNITGDWTFTNNMVSSNLRDGIFIDGAFDPSATFTFANNMVNFNGEDGIHLRNYDAELLTFTENETNNNGRHGIFLENALDSNGNGTIVDINNHTANDNGADGVRISNGSGSLRLVNVTADNNAGTGVTIRNWTTPRPDEFVFIGGDGTQPISYSGNSVGIDVQLLGDGLESNVVITQATVDNNGRGILATASGSDSILNLDILDMPSISGSATEAIRFDVSDGATINNNTINSDENTPMELVGNNVNGESTISYTLSGETGDMSQINSIVRNVNIAAVSGAASGIGVNGDGDSRIRLAVSDSTINAQTGVNVALDNNQNGQVNELFFDELVVQSDVNMNFDLEAGTFTDISVTNSLLESNGINPADGEALSRLTPEDYTPFTDGLGATGIVVTADGGGTVGNLAFDSFTRVNISNNQINDKTFQGVSILATGDAQMLLNIVSNEISRNGPGQNDDPDNDFTFAGPDDGAVDPNNEFFHNGLEITATELSTISGRIINNAFVDNFDRAIQIGTLGFNNLGAVDDPSQAGTINLLIARNRFASDIGVDTENDANIPFELNFGQIGVLNSSGGSICLDVGSNAFESLPLDITNFTDPAVDADAIRIGLDGTSNGFVAGDIGGIFATSPFGLCSSIISSEELFFQTTTGGFDN
jgi:hypothetical protein